MRKVILLLGSAILSLFIPFNLAFALSIETQLWFDPVEQLYDVGDTLTYNLKADIAEADAIFGFGFDLSFDGGTTFIDGPGDSGSYLTFTSFTPNDLFFDPFLPPLWDDGDTIAGEVYFGQPDVWGTDILLGTFLFAAPSTGPIGLESIYLGPLAGDYGIFGEEGLLGATALMPNNPEALAAPVPEPATILLVACGMLGLGVLGRKKMGNNK